MGEYLAHWGLAKGATKPGHKYYARVKVNNKYRYFYSQSEFLAFQKKQTGELKPIARNKNVTAGNGQVVARRGVAPINGRAGSSNTIQSLRKTASSQPQAKSQITKVSEARKNLNLSAHKSTKLNKAESLTSKVQTKTTQIDAEKKRAELRERVLNTAGTSSTKSGSKGSGGGKGSGSKSSANKEVAKTEELVIEEMEDLVLEKFPDMKAIQCIEYDGFYVFKLIPNDSTDESSYSYASITKDTKEVKKFNASDYAEDLLRNGKEHEIKRR